MKSDGDEAPRRKARRGTARKVKPETRPADSNDVRHFEKYSSVIRRRFQIGILFLVMLALAVSAFFMANVAMPRWSHAVSSISVVLFAVPCMWAAKMWLGWRNSIILFTSLGFLAAAHRNLGDHYRLSIWPLRLLGSPWLQVIRRRAVDGCIRMAAATLVAYSVAANVTRRRLLRAVTTTDRSYLRSCARPGSGAARLLDVCRRRIILWRSDFKFCRLGRFRIYRSGHR